MLLTFQKNGESKEFNHTLQRLVRGLGSSKISSRKGFYTTFTVYLSLNPDTSLEKIFSIMDSELKTSSGSTKSVNTQSSTFLVVCDLASVMLTCNFFFICTFRK